MKKVAGQRSGTDLSERYQQAGRVSREGHAPHPRVIRQHVRISFMKPRKKNRSLSHLKKRAVIDTCLLFLVIVVILFMRRYHPGPITKPEQIAPSIKSTTSDTNQPVSPGSPYRKKSGEIRTHQLQEEDQQFLISKGLQDPVNDLVQDLMEHNELIPCKGTVGGRPGFYDPNKIAVISKKHVIADYDDGHVEGTIELAFTVLHGTISWKVVNSVCGN